MYDSMDILQGKIRSQSEMNEFIFDRLFCYRVYGCLMQFGNKKFRQLGRSSKGFACLKALLSDLETAQQSRNFGTASDLVVFRAPGERGDHRRDKFIKEEPAFTKIGTNKHLTTCDRNMQNYKL